MQTAFISIGSNVGDKKKNLETAIECLDSDDRISVDSVSRFYRTQPQNFTDQDWFVNAALKIRTSLLPRELLGVLKQMESRIDKEGKPFRFGPRVIDLDIILYEDTVMKNDVLELPHPRMHERCFVLIPLCDIGAETIHPVLGLRSDELLKKIEKSEAQEVIPLEEEA